MSPYLFNPNLTDEPTELAPLLLVRNQVIDSADNYDYEMANGSFVTDFICFLEKKIQDLAGEAFSASNRRDLDTNLFSDVDAAVGRDVANKMVRFTNAVYQVFKSTMLRIANYDDTRSECRDYCADCRDEGAWSTPEYEGPDPDDEDEYADENDQDMSAEEQEAVVESNANRRAELTRWLERWEENNSREFTCENDCDGFLDHISDEVANNSGIDNTALERAWKVYCAENGISVSLSMPPPPRVSVLIATEPLITGEVTLELPSIRSLLRRARS